jgi:hypothetical protein
MDIYTTATLQRLVASLKRPQTALLSAFFPEIQTSDDETIYFDVENKKRRIAPFVSPLKEGRLVSDEGYTTKLFRPAYIKDKRVLDPNKALKRRMGETIGGSEAPINRHQANLATALADQVDMLMRRKEVMASEVLRTGKCVISGDGYPSVEVDFGRNANHTVTLTLAARWGESGVKPLENIEDWTLTVLQNSGATIRNVIMDTAAWRLFRADAQVEKFLNTRPLSATEEAVSLARFASPGLSYQGAIGQLRFWVYSDWYINDAGSEVAIMPANTVLLVSEDLDGVQHQGAIRDEEAGLQPLEFFSKSWPVPDPSARILLLQSAPLVVPYRVDASFCATVR